MGSYLRSRILEFLYKNRSKPKTDLFPYLAKTNAKDTQKFVCDAIREMREERLIDIINDITPGIIPIDILSTAQPTALFPTFRVPINARITDKGVAELRESRHGKFIKRVSNTTWLIAGTSAIISVLTFAKGCYTTNQSQLQLMQLKEQLRDSTLQIREDFQDSIHRLQDSLNKK
jgi:hypothetical protein